MLCKAGFQGDAIPLAGCKGGALRRADRERENYPVDDFSVQGQADAPRSAEVGETLLGVPRGQGPAGKFSGSGKAQRLFRCSGANVACHFAKLA